MRSILKDSTSNKAIVYITEDATDAKPWTGLAYNATGLEVWIKPLGGTAVQITLSSGIWNEGKFGEYEVTIPDSYYTTLTTYSITGKITGGDVVGEIHKVVAVNDQVAAFGANTTTPATSAEVTTAAGSVTLAAAQPNYAPAKAGDLMGLADNAITAAKIATDAITAAKIATGAITSAKIAANAIGATQIATGAFTSAKFAAGAFDAVWTVATRTLSAFGFNVTVATNNDKTGYSLSQAFPANFAGLAIDGDGKVTTSNPASGGSAHTAEDVAELILANPANKLATNASGEVVASNMRGTDNALLAASYTAPDNAGISATETIAAATATLLDALSEIDSEQLRFTAFALSQAPTGSEGGGLTESGVRSAVGLAEANLDAQLAAILAAANDDAGGSGSTGGGIGSRGASLVRRSTSDQSPIRFTWPVAGATITAERQKADGSYEAAAGTVEFFATESGEHWYRLTYDAADRPEADGTVRYRFTAGAVTRYVFLHQFSAGSGGGSCDYPGETDVRFGVVFANGLHTGVLDVGTGLPTPEYPPGSAGL